MVELVGNRTKQADSHMEYFETQQEVNDTTGHRGKASQDKTKNKTITQAEKPNNKRSWQECKNQENAANNYGHDDITLGMPEEKKAKNSKRKKCSKAKVEREASPTDLPIGPYKPTYCLCNQVSNGEMISCDNEYPIQWFHFSYVGMNHKLKAINTVPYVKGRIRKPQIKPWRNLERREFITCSWWTLLNSNEN